MTGYGSNEVRLEKTNIKVEIRSVNHRFLDVHTKIPRALLFMEDRLKKAIKNWFSRGRIELFVIIEGDLLVERSIQTDWKLMDAYIKQLQKAQERYQLSEEIPISVLASVPELITVQEKEQEPTELEETILNCVNKACEKVQLMRREEGKFLKKDICNRLSTINDMVQMLESRRGNVIDEYRTRIFERINAFVNDTVDLDNSRLHQEIALLAEKGDITEEVTRLYSHISHCYDLIKSDDVIGRKLDFIVQEMHREVNTIGSKSSDKQVGQWTVNLKSEVEKIKEQVQNIE